MASTFLNLDTDTTLGGNSASDSVVSSQKAIKAYADTKQATITSSNKLSASLVSGLATVATSGSYNDLSNKPTIPTTTSSVTSGSTAALTSGGAYTALSEKINTSAIQSSVSSSSTNSQVVGAKLFYDTCGDIENLINAL